MSELKIDPKELRWHMHHGISGFPLRIGFQLVFPRGADFKYENWLIFDLRDVSEMVFRGHSDHTTDKVYLPAQKTSDKQRAAGSFVFTSFVLSPKPNYHNLELHRKNSGLFMVIGRFPSELYEEESPFGFSRNDKGDPNYLRLAFPNETGKFPDTFVLVENEIADGNEYNVVKISSDFSKSDQVEVGKSVVVNWEMVNLEDSPDNLKEVAQKRRKTIENKSIAFKQIARAHARMRG